MAMTLEQFKKSLLKGADSAKGEMRNFLETFSVGVDKDTLKNMSFEDLSALADSLTGEKNRLAKNLQYGGEAKARERAYKIIEGRTNTESIADGIARYNKGQFSSKNYEKDFNKNIERFYNSFKALEKAGAVTQSFDEAVAPVTSKFDPEAIATADRGVIPDNLTSEQLAQQKARSAASSASSSPMQSSTQSVNQILNVEQMAKYSPDQYTKLADGAVVLKTGVTPIAGTTKAYTGSASLPGVSTSPVATSSGVSGTSAAPSSNTGITGYQYQILNLNEMAKYSPDQYTRLADGAVVLKPGVTPIAGTTKAYGGSITSSGTSTGITSSSTSPAASSATDGSSGGYDLYADLPPDIQKMLEGLSPEQQELIKITYNGLISGDEAARADANKALTDAIGLADPYFKQLIRSAQDELQRGVASTKDQAASQIGSLQDRINQLNQDLTYNRDQLSLDQQASLAAQLRQYKSDLSGLQTQFQEAGLAFSSPRAQAERQLSEQQKAVAESTNRQTARALRSLETGTLRDIQSTTQNIADVSRNASNSVIDIMRRGEQTLGTANLPTNTGVTPLGGVTGSIAEQRQNAILGLENTLLKRTAPTDPFATT